MRLIAALAAAIATLAAFGQMPEAERLDTVWAPPVDSLRVSGFEKTLRSKKESLYLTNRTGQTIAGLGLDIRYMDSQGRTLHERTREMTVTIAPDQTVMVDFPSFDTQGLYYYYLSPLPPRTTDATPFKVSVTPTYILQKQTN